MALFNKADFIRAYCYKILPLVYEDSLSYYEVLCKMKSALNDVIENVNNLPEYIADLIEQFITSGAIDEVVREILANYILNVKYPPKGITPAVGDGTADDSAAIQGCIDYAAANGYGAVYFPYGKYLTSPINLKSNVGLYGFDRYSTSIICKGGASAPLFSGTVENVTIANLTLDGNDGFQVNDINLIDATVSNMLLTNLIFKDSNKHVVIAGNGGHLQADNLVFNDCVVNALTVSGNIDVMANNMNINSVSSVRGVSAIEIGSSGGTWEFISKATVPTGLILSGSNNSVNATIENAITPFTDTGANNNVVINGISSTKHYTGNVNDTIGGNKSETITGNVTRSVMQSVVNSITGNLTNTIGGLVTDTITGNKVENITGDKHVTAANSTETVNGDKTVTAGDITETATGHYTVDVTEDYTEDIKGNKITTISGNNDTVTNGSSIEKISNDKTIEAENIKLLPVNPLTYSEPVTGEYFDTIPMLSKNNVPYNLLVENENTDRIGEANIIPSQMWYFTDEGTIYINNAEVQYQQGGTLDETYFYASAIQVDESKQWIYKVNRETGKYTSKSYTTLRHVNGMTVDGNYLIVAAWGNTTNTTDLVIINKDTLDIVATVHIQENIICIAKDSVAGIIYGYGSGNLYKVTRNNLSFVIDFITTIQHPYDYAHQDMAAYNGLIYFGASEPEGIFINDLTGKLIDSHNIYPYTNLYTHRIGEVEGLEIIDGVLHLYSGYNVPSYISTDNGELNPTCMQFSKFNLSEPTAAFSEAQGRISDRFILYVDNNNDNFIRTGSADNPFIDVYEAYYAANGLKQFFGIGSIVRVVPRETPYVGIIIRGNSIQLLTADSGTVNIKSLAFQYFIGAVNNFNVVLGTSNAQALYIQTSFMKLKNISFANDIKSVICMRADDSMLTLTGITFPSTKEIGLMNSFSFIDTYAEHTNKYRLQTSGTLGFPYGTIFAEKYQITTTPTLVKSNKLDMASGYTRFNYYDFMINGNVYTMNKSGTFNVDNNIVTVSIANGGITVSATKNVTCDIFIRG